MTRNFVRPIVRIWFLLAALASLSCAKGGVSGGAAKSGQTGNFSLDIKLVYPTGQGATWTPITSADRIYIKGLDVTITGTCSRGIATIKADEGAGAYSETSACSDAGTYVWAKTYTAGAQEGDKSLTLTGVGGDGTALTSVKQLVRIDNTPPTAPVITAPGTNPFKDQTGSSAYTITGTVPADMVQLIGPGGTVLSVTSGGFSYPVTLIDGTSLDFSFYGFDLAGNQSATTTQSILWHPSIFPRIALAISGGSFLDSVTNFTTEASAGPMPAQFKDTTTNYSIETGFNYLVNTMRAQ